MTQSLEANLAVLTHQTSSLVEGMARVESAQLAAAKAQEESRMEFLRIDHRLELVEAQLAAASPTIKEFLEVKQRVMGAGIMGKWLWVAGGVLLGMVAKSREEIIKWVVGQ